MQDTPEKPGELTAPSPAGVGILLVVTLIWGTTFVATRALVAGSTPALPPGLLTLCRFSIASIAILPLARKLTFPPGIWLVGLDLSFWLWAGYATQAIGLKETTASKSAFITSLNVVFVPLFTIFAGKRVGWLIWSAAILAVAGVGLLSYDGSPPNMGDLWTLGCAITYAVYILRLELYTGRFDWRLLTTLQLWGVAAFSLLWTAGEVATGSGWGVWTPGVALAVLYLGTIASLVTTLLQTIGQKNVPATYASLIYTTEPVFASAIAFIGFGETLGPRGLIGAAIILTAAVMSQVAPLLFRKRVVTEEIVPAGHV